MKAMRAAAPLVFTFCALTLGACSGGGSSQVSGIEGSGDTVAASPASGSGSITGFGSVYVNGIRYGTEDAEVWINDRRATEAELDTGMVVKIEASVSDQGVVEADEVRYEPLLVGPVTEVEVLDATRKQLTALGQTLVVGEDATFVGTEYDALATDTVISVSGFAAADDVVVVSRLEQVAAASLPPTWTLEARVSTLDLTNNTLQLGELSVDFNDAVFDEGTRNDLQDGERVRVEGTLRSDGVFMAQAVRINDNLVRGPIDAEVPGAMALEGIIDSFDSLDNFTVQGTTVDASNAIVARGDVSSLAEGARVVVHGELDGAGVLLAETLALVLPNEIHIRGLIDTVEIDVASLTVAGNPMFVDDLTTFQDRGAQNNRRIRLRDLQPGESVEIFARRVEDQWLATRIERWEESELAVVSGPAVQVTGSNFRVLGIAVDASAATLVPAEASLADLKPGTFVTVEGRYTALKAMAATEIIVHERGPCKGRSKAGCGNGGQPTEDDSEDEGPGSRGDRDNGEDRDQDDENGDSGDSDSDEDEDD